MRWEREKRNCELSYSKRMAHLKYSRYLPITNKNLVAYFESTGTKRCTPLMRTRPATTNDQSQMPNCPALRVLWPLRTLRILDHKLAPVITTVGLLSCCC